MNIRSGSFGLLLFAIPTLASAQSSRENRENYQFMAHLQAAGLSEGYDTGYELQYAFTPDERIGFSYTKSDEISLFLSSSSRSATARTHAVSYQRFLLNSFFVKAGLAQHKKTIVRKGYTFFSDHDYDYENRYTREDWGALFGLGNQWQWRSGFTLGCEWVGVYLPAVNTEVRGSRVEWTEENERVTSSLDRTDKSKSAIPRAVQFKLGWAF